MTITGRMLKIEARRSLGLWLFPPVAFLVWFTTRETLPAGIWLWPDTSFSIQQTLVLAGPLAAGMAAWAATRERRLGTEELLATTSQPTAVRLLVAWASSMVWIALGYLAAVAILFASAYLGGVYGIPTVWPVILGLFALVADSAIGFAAGQYVPSRFTAPLIAIALYWVQGVTIAYSVSSLRYLSPVVDLYHSVFYGVVPNIFVAQSLWLLGLAIVALVFAVRRGERRSVVPWIALAAGLAATATGAVVLLGTPSQVTATQLREARIAYEPVCDDGDLRVCVHPSYRQMLPEASATIRGVTGPLAGVDGGPERAEQTPYDGTGLTPDGTLTFYVYDGTSMGDGFASSVTLNLVFDPRAKQGGAGPTPPDAAQSAIGGWLLEQAGREASVADNWAVGKGMPRVAQARERFDALPAEKRTAWLDANYRRLRAGEVAVEEIP